MATDVIDAPGSKPRATKSRVKPVEEPTVKVEKETTVKVEKETTEKVDEPVVEAQVKIKGKKFRPVVRTKKIACGIGRGVKKAGQPVEKIGVYSTCIVGGMVAHTVLGPFTGAIHGKEVADRYFDNKSKKNRSK